MKNKVIIILSWTLVFLTAFIIFCFSWQPAKSSVKTSEDMVVQILDVVMDKEQITTPVIKKAQLPIRKVAHFGIYMLLGFTLISAMEKSFKLKRWLLIVISESACAIYAVLDETNQIFRLGRTPYFVDTIVDSLGSISGIFFYFGAIALYTKVINKIEQKKDKQTV